MKVVLWVGNEPNQKALANKIHAMFPLAGIVTETRKRQHNKFTLLQIADKIIEKIFLGSIGKAWWHMISFYKSQYATWPAVPVLNVENINSPQAFEFSQQLMPDLIVVSGTRLVKEKMLSIAPSIGIINLHTGLSPYIKGGPNCTNWCIATGQFHLIGNTVMWIDAGIDSGNIITTQHTPFTGNENLNALHITVMEHAHTLYLKAINSLATGSRQSIPQKNIAPGVTYYTKNWKLMQKINLIKNLPAFRKKINSHEVKQQQQQVVTIPLK